METKIDILEIDKVGFAQYDSLRIEYENRLEQQYDKLTADKNKTVKYWKNICIILGIIIVLFLSGLFYFLYNYEIVNFSQDSDGFNNAINGIQGDVFYGAEDKNNNEQK